MMNMQIVLLQPSRLKSGLHTVCDNENEKEQKKEGEEEAVHVPFPQVQSVYELSTLSDFAPLFLQLDNLPMIGLEVSSAATDMSPLLDEYNNHTRGILPDDLLAYQSSSSNEACSDDDKQRLQSEV